MKPRIGLGYDLHRLIPGTRLILGGVEIECEFKPEGHSDADVLLHALVDAMLGAAARGDIGDHFPDTDAEWKDADSRVFVRRAKEIIEEAGFIVGNVDANIFLERPKLGTRKDEMAGVIASLLGIDPECVSVKAKTGERIGKIGTSQAVAAQVAVILFEK